MKKKRIALAIVTLCFNLVISQATFKTMFYNVLNYPLQGPLDRIDNLQLIIDAYLPDIFMVCEINNEQGANDILLSIQNVNPNYQGAAFVENTSDDDSGDQNDLQNMLYFDGTKFSLEDQTEIATNVRDFNIYTLKLNTVDQNTNPVRLHVLISHLKSSSGTTNQNIRFEMVQELVAYLETMPSASYILFGGDLNFYTASEDGFMELLDDTNNISFVDPADRIGSWHNNANFIDVFTQSTRTQTGLGGATGGFDDRFDFILTSSNMMANTELFYVEDSYEVFGNNGESDCFNQEINSNECSGTKFDQAIREVLYLMSDHLPVTLSLETSESLSIDEYNIDNTFRIIGSNLVSERLHIGLEPHNVKSRTFSIYNYLGQQVLKHPITNLNQYSVNVSNLTNGIYYVVLSNNESKPLKFIRN